MGIKNIVHKIWLCPYEPLRRDNMMYEDIYAKMHNELIQYCRPVKDSLHSYTEKDNSLEIWYRFRFAHTYEAKYDNALYCFNSVLAKLLKRICPAPEEYHIDYRIKNLGDCLDCVITCVWNDD